MAQFINPYNFVPVGNTVERQPYTELNYHHRYYRGDGNTGRLTCRMTTLTRLFIPSRRSQDIDQELLRDRHGNRRKHDIFKKFLRNHLDQLIVPGTSIRGVIRSVAETISHSCLTLFDGEYGAKRGKVDYSSEVDEALSHQNCKIANENGRPITDANQGLCPCCRIFGMANEQEQDANRNEPILRNVFASKVIFGDATLQTTDGVDTQSITFKELSSPKSYHAPFYIENNQIKGRKFYYHQHDDISNYQTSEKTWRNQTIEESVTSNAEFTFEVTFTNLTDSELGLLLWALELNEQMAHKIGMGKPIGLGSIRIQVQRLELIEPMRRYTTLGGGKNIFEESSLSDRLVGLKNSYHSNPFSALPELEEILTFDPTSQTTVRYPGRDWFNTNRRTPLPTDGRLDDAGGGTRVATMGTSDWNRATNTLEPPRAVEPGTRQSLGELFSQEPKTTQDSKPTSAELVVQVKGRNRKGNFIVEVEGKDFTLDYVYGINEGDSMNVLVERDDNGNVTKVTRKK